MCSSDLEPQLKKKDEKQKLINQLNIPAKRNIVKILFTHNLKLIEEKKDQNERNHYLNKLQKILKSYEKINEKDFSDGNNVKLEEEEIVENQWIIEKNSNNLKMFKVLTVLIPLAYVISYLYVNFK